MIVVSKNCFLCLRIENTQKHVWQLFPLFSNLFSMFSIWYFWKTISTCFPYFLHYELNQKKKKWHVENKLQTLQNASYNKLNQIPNPHIENKHTNPKICVLNFFFPISFSKWEINACVDGDDNAAIWTSHGAMEVGKYVYVRERKIRGVEKWRWWDEWWREQCGFYGTTNHEKREWEIVIEILEDKEDGEEKIIWG